MLRDMAVVLDQHEPAIAVPRVMSDFSGLNKMTRTKVEKLEKSIEELCEMSIPDLLMIRGFGFWTVEYIRRFLKDLGLSLRGDPGGYIDPEAYSRLRGEAIAVRDYQKKLAGPE
jgi:hypothetical protein